jgi:hypothetical protein
MGDLMSNRQILLVAIALGFLGGFSFVSVTTGAMAGGASADRESAYTAAGD